MNSQSVPQNKPKARRREHRQAKALARIRSWTMGTLAGNKRGEYLEGINAARKQVAQILKEELGG